MGIGNLLLSSQSLFDPAWTEGNLYTIDWLTKNLGNFACMIISAVGFLIVIFSILKNAISGLYVVNPNFWDKVSDIKNQAVDVANSGISGAAGMVPGKGNAAAAKLGGFFTYILSAIPNVRALTDFEDGEIDKKQYFAKSIPLLIAQIFIGMLIFFGYPAQIANWIGSAGTEVLDIVLTNVDPIATIENLSTKVISADFATEGSDDPYEKAIYEASRSAWTDVVGRATDIEKGPRQELANKIEVWIMDTFNPYANTIGAVQGYRVSSDTSYVTTQPTVPSSYTAGDNGVYMSMASNGTITYRVWKDVSSFMTGSQMVGPTDYLTVSFTCTPAALETVNTISGEWYTSITGNIVKTNSGYRLDLSSDPIKYSQTAQDNCITGTPVGVSIEIKGADGNTTATVSGTMEISGTNLYIMVPSSTPEETVLAMKSNKLYVSFGFNTSSLKYYSISGTSRVEIPLTGIVINGGGTGLKLNNMATDESPLSSSSAVQEKLNSTTKAE